MMPQQQPSTKIDQARTGRVQFVIYAVTALLLGFLTFRSMMWGVWGAPVHPAHYMGLLGAFALFVGAIISLSRPAQGRFVSMMGLAGMGTFWLPATASLVPQHDVIISPVAFLVVGLFFAAAGFALLYPRRWRWSLPALGLLVCTAIGIAGMVTARRLHDGEYARPSFAYFHWHPGGEGLEVRLDPDGWMDSEARALLARSGIHGTLEWSGSSGEHSAGHRVILLAQRQPVSPFRLHYPRQGILIYAYDGSQWRVIPESAATFPSFATIQPEGSNTMLWQEDADGGRQGTTAFSW